MWGLDYSTLKVGDEVAIARSGSWSLFSEGVYAVVKVNKMKVFLQRKSDGYERVFSVKRRCEFGDSDRYRSAFLETVADHQAREEKRRQEQKVWAAWSTAEKAAQNKNISQLRQALANLELLVDKK